MTKQNFNHRIHEIDTRILQLLEERARLEYWNEKKAQEVNERYFWQNVPNTVSSNNEKGIMTQEEYQLMKIVPKSGFHSLRHLFDNSMFQRKTRHLEEKEGNLIGRIL